MYNIKPAVLTPGHRKTTKMPESHEIKFGVDLRLAGEIEDNPECLNLRGCFHGNCFIFHAQYVNITKHFCF